MLLSVIVIVYNEEKFIRECVDSIITQTYRDFELILVDDGSTDSTGVICDEYAQKDNRIKVIHQANKGMSKARYAGFLQAQGDYVTFVDGDDKIMPDTYEKALAHLTDDVDIITYGCIRWDTDSVRTVVDPGKLPPGIYDKERLYTEVYPRMLWNKDEQRRFDLEPSMCFKIMRREILGNAMEITKDIAIDAAEDSLRIYIMMKFVKRMVVLSDCFYYHRHRPLNVIPPYIRDRDFFQKLCVVYECLSKHLDFHPSLPEQVDYFFMTYAQLKAGCYMKKGGGDFAKDIRALMSTPKYFFPFQLVPVHARVALYGAGAVGKTFYSQISRTGYCNVVLWVDKAWQKYFNSYKMIQISPVESLLTGVFDKLVICNARESTRHDIYNDLIAMGIEKEKLIKEIS